jgi:hypothetical protein
MNRSRYFQSSADADSATLCCPYPQLTLWATNIPVGFADLNQISAIPAAQLCRLSFFDPLQDSIGVIASNQRDVLVRL